MDAAQRWLQSWKFRIQNWLDFQRMRWHSPTPEEQRHLEDVLRRVPRQPGESLEEKHRKVAAGQPILLTNRQVEALLPFVTDQSVVERYREHINIVNQWMDQRQSLQSKGAWIAYQRLVEYRLMRNKSGFASRNPAENVELAVTQSYLRQTLEFNYQRSLAVLQQISEHHELFHSE